MATNTILSAVQTPREGMFREALSPARWILDLVGPSELVT